MLSVTDMLKSLPPAACFLPETLLLLAAGPLSCTFSVWIIVDSFTFDSSLPQNGREVPLSALERAANAWKLLEVVP